MVNKTIKVAVAASILVAGGSVYPTAGGDNTVITQCIQGGQNVSANGQACSTTAGSGAKGSRARGETVALNTSGAKTQQLKTSKDAKGSIQIPEIGSINLYQYGQIRIAVASFSLTNQAENPQNLSQDMKRIINAAAANHAWAQSLIWVGRALPGETTFTEVTETASDLADLSQSRPLNYQAIDSKSVRIMIPASKNAMAVQSLVIDFNPINKQ